MRRTITALTLLALCSACETDSGPTSTGWKEVVEYGSLRGEVRSDTGDPIGGASVRLERVTSPCWSCGPGTATGVHVGDATADATGVYEFEELQTGSYWVSVSKAGYYTGRGPGDPPSVRVIADHASRTSHVLHYLDMSLEVDFVDAAPDGDRPARVEVRLTNLSAESQSYRVDCANSRWVSLIGEDGEWHQLPATSNGCDQSITALAAGATVGHTIEIINGADHERGTYRLPAGQYEVRVQVMHYAEHSPFGLYLGKSGVLRLD